MQGQHVYIAGGSSFKPKKSSLQIYDSTQRLAPKYNTFIAPELGGSFHQNLHLFFKHEASWAESSYFAESPTSKSQVLKYCNYPYFWQ